MESIEEWIAALSAHPSVSLLEPLAKLTDWPSLFSTELEGGGNGSAERLAQQLVEAILSTSFEAYPGLLRHVSLPSSYEQLSNMTPYHLALDVYTNWSTEEQLFEVLGMVTGMLMSVSLQDCMRFCVQAILYRFNLQIRPEYRALFVESGDV